MHHVRVEGTGVVARIKHLLIAKGIKHRYKQRLYSFEASEAILEEVIAVQKENPDWRVSVELVLGTDESEFVAHSSGVSTMSEKVPVIRMSPEEHAAQQVILPVEPLPAESSTTPIVLPEAPSAEDEAFEQARQLAEMAGLPAPVRVPQARTPAQAPAQAPRPATPVPMAPPSQPKAVATGRRAQLFVRDPGDPAPRLDIEVAVRSNESAQQVYYRENQGLRKDRLAYVAIVNGPTLLDRFPRD
jgi:hypothetical protein